jgi:hypothetical protein
MGPECGDRHGAARPHRDKAPHTRLIRDRNVRVLGDNEGVEPTLLHRRAQPSWTNALIGDESCDTKLHTSPNLPTPDQRPVPMTKRVIWLMIRVRRRVSHPARREHTRCCRRRKSSWRSVAGRLGVRTPPRTTPSTSTHPVDELASLDLRSQARCRRPRSLELPGDAVSVAGCWRRSETAIEICRSATSRRWPAQPSPRVRD